MIEQSNHEYFAARAAAEFQLSRTATDPRAHAAHADMARRYVDLADQFLDASSVPKHPDLRIVT